MTTCMHVQVGVCNHVYMYIMLSMCMCVCVYTYVNIYIRFPVLQLLLAIGSANRLPLRQFSNAGRRLQKSDVEPPRHLLRFGSFCWPWSCGEVAGQRWGGRWQPRAHGATAKRCCAQPARRSHASSTSRATRSGRQPSQRPEPPLVGECGRAQHGRERHRVLFSHAPRSAEA